MTAPETAPAGRRRAPILILVAVALVAGAFAGRAHEPERPAAPTVVDAVQTPGPRAISTAWYCPGLPPSFPAGNQTLTLSNLGATDSDAIVTIHPDGGADPVSRTLSVPHGTVRTYSRASLEVAPEAGPVTAPSKPLPPGPLVVEPFSADVVVSAGLESNDALAVVPCATQAATDWQFAAGTTVRGVSQWLVLQDPFSADARVDVTLRTDSGLELLPALTGLDVPARSRVVIPIHDQAVRRERVAVEVHASVGQVVAAETLDFGPDSGTRGVATTVGALGPANRWWFSDGRAVSNSKQWVAVTDVAETDANVVVQASIGAKGIVNPVLLTVASGTVSWVQIGGCSRNAKGCLAVPDGSAFDLTVQADAKLPIVAQTLSRFDDPKTAAGATSSVGSTAPARRWVVPRTRARGQESTSVSLVNTNVPPAHVAVQVVSGGTIERPAALADLAIPSNGRMSLPSGLDGISRHADAAIVITSDEPIYAESTIYAKRDATRAPGVPTR